MEGEGRGEGGGGLADTWTQAVFQEAEGGRGGSLQRGAARLTKEKEASPQAGPLHAGLSRCLLCSLALGSPFSYDPSSGSLTRIMSLLGCSPGFLERHPRHLTSATCFTSRFDPHPQLHSVRVSMWTQEHAFSQSSPGSAEASEAVLANDCSEAQQNAIQASVFL